ncbi:MAG: hypothetical protein ACRDL3_15730 [Solirubrobacterales bacterium]
MDPENYSVEAIARFRRGTYPGVFAADAGVIWAGRGRRLVPIDPRTGRAAGEPIRLGVAIGATSLIAEENGFWFQGYEPNEVGGRSTVDRFNRRTGEIDVSIDPPKTPIALALAPDSLWVLNYESSVTRIDLRARESAARDPEAGAVEAPCDVASDRSTSSPASRRPSSVLSV